MSITIYTIIDDDIVINETIHGNANATTIYDYLIKIVSTYSNYRILMYLVLYTDSNVYYIRLYDNYE